MSKGRHRKSNHIVRTAAIATLVASVLVSVVLGNFALGGNSIRAVADTGLSPLQVAQANLYNCQLLFAHPNSLSQKNRAQICITDETAKINLLLGLTPSPSPSTTSVPTPTPTDITPTPSSSPTITPTVSPTPTVTPTPTPTPSPSPTSASFPNASNTGVPPGTNLIVMNSVDVTRPDTVIDGWDIHGFLFIHASGVTVRNTRVRCDASDCVHVYNDNLLVSHVEIGPDTGYVNAIGIMDGTDNTSAPLNRNVYEYINLHNTGDGFRCDGGFTFRNSYLHQLDLGAGGFGTHSDACQATNTGNMYFYHNTIEGGNTSCFLIQSNPANVLIENNLLLGTARDGAITSYAINVGASVPQGGVKFFNNVLNTTWQSGPDGSSSNYLWNSSNWFGNTYQDGTPIPPS